MRGNLAWKELTELERKWERENLERYIPFEYEFAKRKGRLNKHILRAHKKLLRT